jgi:PAS domain S-box-containing protein
MKQIMQKKIAFYHCWCIDRAGIGQMVWGVARSLVISLVMTFASLSDVVADERDSLRNVLLTRTLHDTVRAEVLEHLVLLYMDAKPDTALLYAWQLYAIAHSSSEANHADKRMMSAALTALVNGYTNADKPDKVLQYAFQLLRLSEDLRDTVRLARALYAAGFASGQLSTKNNPDENASALQYLQRALALQQQDRRLTVECYNAMGRIYRKEQLFDSALRYHTRALELAISYDIPAQQGWALNSIAICYENTGNPAKALESALASLRCYERVGNPTTIAFPLNTLTRLYQKSGDFQKALLFAKRSLAVATAAQARSAQYRSCASLAEILEALGDYRGALAYQRRSVVLRDSIAVLEHIDDFRLMQAEAELHQSQRERTLLLNEQAAQQLALQRQQIMVGVVMSFLLLFAVLLLLLLRARRVVRRRNMQLERATEKVQEQMRIQAAQHLEIVKFKRVLDESTDYIVMSDVNTGKILYMNKAYRTLIGVDAPPETLEKLMNIVYPHDIAERVLRESIPQAIEHGILTGETALFDAKGSQVLVLHTTVCHKDEHGSSALLSSIMRDVTERKHQEQALEQSNTRLRSLLETVPFSIAVTRRSDGKPLFNNAPMQKQNGLSPNIDEHPYALDYYQHPEDRARVLAELVAKGRIDSIELALKTPAGEHWWALLSMVPMDFEGEPALFSAFQDITEHKQAEDALRASYREVKNFRVALEAIAIVSIADTSGAILYANEQFILVSQYSTQELIGQNHRIVNSGHHDREFFKTLWRTISSGKPWHDEVLNRAKDGSNYWVDTVISPMFDEDGKVYQYISIRYDITARKHAEEHLRHTSEEILRQKDLLEEQARDIELANSQLEAINEVLIERNKQLLELDREKNEIMGIVTHDLKNPIAAIRGLVGLLNEGVVEAGQMAEVHAQIAVAADRMMMLVNNLLDVNRLESGATAFQIVEFDMLPLVESVVWQYRVQAEAKKITLHHSSTSASNVAFADEQAMMQVLDNIISNAVKYSPHGKCVFVRVSSSETTIRVEVQDEGEGISPDDMTKLFGKFARLSARPTGGEHSTGLGLSIVKKIVEAMQGRVWCESELGKGATFIVELPKVA